MALPTDWRELLGSITANPVERERIANEVGVHVGTLVRWVNGDTTPRPQNVRQLLRALPKLQRSQMSDLLPFPDTMDAAEDTALQEIPYAFIMEVFEARATVTDQLRGWTIRRLVLQRALKQLDAEGVGMAITVVRCMPPHADGKIRSLREFEGLGTPPWDGDLEEKAMLLGAESLAGHVTASCRLEQIGDLRSKKTFLPAYQAEHEVSTVACPIMYGSRIGGCLLLSSTQTNYFVSEMRQTLVRGYAHLLALAFEPHNFYDPACLEIHVMPPLEVQQDLLIGFRQRVLRRIQASANTGRRLSNFEAEQEEWQQIEQTMLSYPTQP